MSAHRSQPAGYTCHVFHGVDFRVTSGANLGDSLAAYDDLCAGDVYRLSDSAETWGLAVADDPDSGAQMIGAQGSLPVVARGSEIGQEGALIHIDGRLTFMAGDGDVVELLLIRLEPASDGAVQFCMLPLSQIGPRQTYTLIGLSDDIGEVRWRDVISVAFQRGTLVSLAGGLQVPIETLKKGDRILTRDSGAQPLRWIGHKTVRAIGAFAPVVIPKGMMGNSNDLIVSQHQRLFVYQRGRDRITETAEMLVKSKYLVDNDKILIREGGFADYYTLVFDQHEVIYAESIPCESLEVNAATLAQIPDDLAQSVETALPDLSHQSLYGTEASAEAMDRARQKLFRQN